MNHAPSAPRAASAPVLVRRLGPGDEPVLELLAREDADFDIPGRGGPQAALSADAAQAYLSNPDVLHWVAEQAGAIVGFMYCHHLHKRAGDAGELLLYEIGVRKAHRQRKVGRTLVETMRTWMEAHHVRESWVLADNPGAVAFYKACGFKVPLPEPAYMTHELDSRDAGR